jgi:hypothetical protein
MTVIVIFKTRAKIDVRLNEKPVKGTNGHLLQGTQTGSAQRQKRASTRKEIKVLTAVFNHLQLTDVERTGFRPRPGKLKL